MCFQNKIILFMFEAIKYIVTKATASFIGMKVAANGSNNNPAAIPKTVESIADIKARIIKMISLNIFLSSYFVFIYLIIILKYLKIIL